MKSIGRIFILLVLLTAKVSAQDKLIGTVAWPANRVGIYDVDLETSTLTPRLVDREMLTLRGGGAFGQAAVRRDNLYYVTNYFTEEHQIHVYHAVYDLNTNQRVWIKRNGLLAAAPMDMTYCEQDGKTYGCFHCPEGLGEAYVFGTLNLETFEVTRIKLIYQRWLAMAAAPDGTLYAINGDGMLLKVDKATGNTRVVGQTEAPVYFESSATISNDGDVMYLNVTAMDGSAFILTIDLSNGQTVSTTSFDEDEEVLGLAVLEETDVNAPGLAPRFEVPTCPTNKATVSWDMPAGNTSMRAILTMDGNEVYSGNHVPGASVAKEIDAKLTGYHTFALRTANGDAVSPAVSVRRWVGQDTPCVPQNVRFTRSGNTNVLTWDAVTAGVNEGYLDKSKITYSVYRYPDGQLVAGSLTEPRWSEEMDEPTSLTTIRYAVEAVVGGSGERSQKGESNSISFSSIHPPYSETFNTDMALEAYTIIDGNNDGETWHWYTNGKMRIFGSDYNSLNDWLITPPVHLEGGEYYEFSFTVHGFKRAYTEFFEVCCGRSNTASAMNVKLLPETQLSADNDSKFIVGYLAPETGDYYFGMHATSPAGTQYIYTDNWTISEGKAPVMPAQPDGLTLTRVPKGHVAVDVAFNLPTKTVGGDELTEITRCVVMRDGYDVIKDMNDVKPGQRIEFIDEPFNTTFRRYSVYAYNAAGVSAPAEAVEYVGPYAPAQPTNFKVRRTNNDGEVVMGWEEPTTDKYGEELDNNLITYTVAAIVDGEPKYIAEKRPVVGLTYQAQAPGQPQRFVSFALYAQTEGGSSTKLESTPCPVGAPYETPFVESFAGADSRTAWYPDDVFGISAWDYANDETLGYITSSDSDNGFIYAQSMQKGNTSTLNSGLIHLGNSNPILEFHYWSHGVNDLARTMVNLMIGDEVKEVSVVNHAAANGWNTATVSLDAYAGQEVQLQLLAQFGDERTVAYDNIRIMSDVAYNLSLADINIPTEVQAGKQFAITATVQNNGKDDVAGTEYTTRLLRDGKESQRKRGFGTLRTGKSATVTFNEMLDVLAEGEHTYEIVLEYADDEMLADNTSGNVKVQCFVPDYPVPTATKATEYALGTSDGCRTLVEWGVPEEPDEQPVVTEDFESYPAWSKANLGDWTLVDRDLAPVGSVPLEIPGVTAGSTFLSYIVVNGAENSKISVHTGNQALLTIWVKNKQNDDWLISPALSGHAQTISLWARSGSPSYPETFQLMGTTQYSTNPADYKEIDYAERISKEWTEYKFNLPEGTVHFAVRCISLDAYYFTIDDISYINDLHSTYDLLGYNVYRDGVKVNSEPVETVSFADIESTRSADYHVTAVYRKGESRPVHIDTKLDGIGIVTASSANSKIYDLSGRRLVRTTKGVNIVDGKKVIK